MRNCLSITQEPFSDKNYGFCFSKRTGEILIIIAERVYQALHTNGEARSFDLCDSKAFDRV